jgi:HK97 family phage major capsid protein
MNEKMNELVEQLEAAETVEEINEVKSAIEAEKAHQAAIAEKSAILEGLKGEEKSADAPKDEPCKTLGEYAAKNLDLSSIRSGASKSAGTGFGFKAYTDPQTSQQIIEYDRNVVDVAVMRELAIRRLFGAEVISGNALKYFILGAKEDNSAPAPGSVAENGAKPQFHIVESSATVTLQKIAGWFYETDELIEDNAFLKSAIDNRGLFELDAAVENYLMTTLLGTSGLGAATYAHGGHVSADDIFAAMMTIKGASRH